MPWGRSALGADRTQLPSVGPDAGEDKLASLAQQEGFGGVGGGVCWALLPSRLHLLWVAMAARVLLTPGAVRRGASSSFAPSWVGIKLYFSLNPQHGGDPPALEWGGSPSGVAVGVAQGRGAWSRVCPCSTWAGVWRWVWGQAMRAAWWHWDGPELGMGRVLPSPESLGSPVVSTGLVWWWLVGCFGGADTQAPSAP